MAKRSNTWSSDIVVLFLETIERIDFLEARAGLRTGVTYITGSDLATAFTTRLADYIERAELGARPAGVAVTSTVWGYAKALADRLGIAEGNITTETEKLQNHLDNHPTGGGGGGSDTGPQIITKVGANRFLPTPLGTAGQVAKVNSAGTGLIWAADNEGTGGGDPPDRPMTPTTPFPTDALERLVDLETEVWVAGGTTRESRIDANAREILRRGGTVETPTPGVSEDDFESLQDSVGVNTRGITAINQTLNGRPPQGITPGVPGLINDVSALGRGLGLRRQDEDDAFTEIRSLKDVVDGLESTLGVS